MKSPAVFVLILAVIFETGHVRCQVNTGKIYASQNPIPVGSNVTLFTTSSVAKGVWLFNSDIIVMIFPGDNIISNTWNARVTFNSSTSSLSIMSLTVADSGLYTLEAINLFHAELTLSVQVPISNVTVVAKATNLVEFNDTAVLMCSASSGSFPSYAWMNGSSAVTAGERVQLSNGNTTLTIVNVTRYDMGPFSCNVSNGVSYEVSQPVHLNISYGPSNTMMTLEPVASKYIYKTGSNITVSCSAQSRPPAMIMWMVNDVYLNQSGPQLQLQNATGNSSGNYKCIFYNAVTQRFSSASEMIWVLDPLAAVVLNHSSGPAILNQSFTLYCKVTGTVDSILWWRNGQLISAGNTTSSNNNTLIFNPVQLSDNGSYQCQAFNAVSNMTSNSYKLVVNYGPEMPTITGPNVAKTGDNITLSCHASSYPPSHYTWYFGDSLVANTSKYVTPPLTINMTGNYTCMVYNYITGINRTAYKMLTVVDPIQAVNVKAPDYSAIEGHPYMLTCNVTGPADHVYWMMNGHPLQGDNTTVTVMNMTVSFNPVEHNNTGRYQCKAVNAVGNMTSHPYMLLVNFGPETPIIKGPHVAETGQPAVFNCSAMSVPPSQISWWFNGTLVANTSVFTIGYLSLNMSGEYTCMAYNNVTGANRTKSVMLTVIQAITSVMIQNSTVPINSKNFTLICEVTGPYDTIYWLKDNQTLNTSTSANSTMLYFTPVTMYNNGKYQCVATNKAAQHQSPQYTLLVNYGPLNVTITGPDSAQLGYPVSLSCSAVSWPVSQFQWIFAGSSHQSLAMNSGSVITFIANQQNEGNYTCQAYNPVTNVMIYKSKVFTVASHASATHFPSHSALMLMGVFVLSLPMLFN